MSLDAHTVNVEENTDFVADLDCGEGENPDLGTDICAVTDKNVNGFGEDTDKPSSYVLSLGDALTSEINSTQGDKLEVSSVMGDDSDGDGSYLIRVSGDDDPSKTDKLFFEGDVASGESFEASEAAFGNSFGSETFVHILSSDGSTVLQTINFHTSCSAPLVIGEQYGSVSLAGATLEGKDTGTIYTVGQTEADGDAGVVYEITGGNDADDFTVDPDTGEVTFKETPDFENPTDSDGDNKYDVEVTAFFVDAQGVKTGEICEVKPLEVCVEDDCINILENTSPVIADLDCGEGENPDAGKDICAVIDKDMNGFGEDTEKPSSYILTLGELSGNLVTSDTTGKVTDKVEVGAVGGTDDGDGSYFIRVSKDSDPSKTDGLFFSGTVEQGDNFEAAGDFGSETFVHIYSSDGGSLLQTINFHTSCSSPLIIDDQYGSITLSGATLEGKDTGTIYTVGQTEADGDAGVVYEITGGNDADDFTVDPDTGEVTFKETPDFENPTDSDGDNKYDVEVTAFFVDAQGVKTGEICEVKPLEVCVEDDCINILENTSPVIADLDCGEGENPDAGKDICAVIDKDMNGFGEDTEKPSSYILTLGELSGNLVTSDTTGKVTDKVEVGAVGGTDDGDGSYFIRVSKDSDPSKTDGLFFSGTVEQGDNFEAAGDFGSETFVHIYSSDGGSLLQTINFHTSCSSPLIIDDQYGSITLSGATLEGKDTGTIYTVGQTEADGDAGVVYEITGGNDADDFTVDPDTGEVTFKETPDFENPTDSDGDNKYDVEVTAFFVDAQGVKTGEICEVKPLEVCVEDQDCINILENTNPGVIADLDCEVDDENPDLGLEICAERDKLRDQGIDADKPNQLTLTLNDDLTSIIDSGQQDSKLEVDTFNLMNPDGGGLYVRVSDSDKPGDNGTVYFQGDVNFGQSFTAMASAAGDDKFGSETYIHIFSANGGQLLQTINYHTSCSAPITIGDQIGLVSLEGVGLLNKDTGETIEFGGSAPREVVYEITGGDGFDPMSATSPFFNVDPQTGEVTLAFDPDFENPLDDNMDNSYVVEVTGFFVNADGSREICEVKPIEICIEDVPEVGSLSGRYFCDTNDNDVDDGQTVDPGVVGVVVTAFDAAGIEVGSTVTGEDGTYSFNNLPAGIYSVVFADPDAVLTGKTLVTPNVGADDTIDSDAIGDITSSTITGIVVEADAETLNNDAGVEIVDTGTSVIEGRIFCDENDNSVDDSEPGVGGVTVTLSNGATTVTNPDGSYAFTGLLAGTYTVTFPLTADGKVLVDSNVGGDDTIDSDADQGTGETGPITVGIGETSSDNDAGVEDPGTASVGDLVFLDANGNGVFDAGDGVVAGVTVDLLDADGNVVATTTTDAAGEYLFDGLDAGEYSALFTAPDGLEFTGQSGAAADAVNNDSDADVGTGETGSFILDIGEAERDVDAGLVVTDTGTASISGTYFCDENDDDVQNAGEPGISGALVTLLDAAGNPTGLTATTNANGNYAFTGLTAGTYSVLFAADASGKTFVAQDDPNGNGNDTNDSDVDPTTGETGPITVGIGETSSDNDAGVEDPGTASLLGRLFCDENDNSVDDGEPGVAGVTVTLSNGATAVTDADGNYAFTGLKAGTYSVTFPTSVGDKVLVEQNVGGDDTIDSDADQATGTTDPVTLAIGEQSLNNDAGVEIVDTGTSVIEGRIFCDENDNSVDDSEPGVGGVTVTLSNGATTVTNPDGSYAFTGLLAGTYTVTFPLTADGKVLVDSNVGGDDTIDSDADQGTGETGPITVGIGETSSDNDAGVEDPGTASVGDLVFLDANGNGVFDAGDGVVAGVTVDLLDADGNVVATTTTDAAGEYLFDGLDAGEYSALFTAPDGLEFTGQSGAAADAVNNDSDADVGTGETGSFILDIGEAERDVDAGLVVTDTGTASISGTYFCDENDDDVQNAGEPGISGALVTLLDAAGNPTGLTATTNANGNYAFTGLTAGTYSVLFAAEASGKTFVAQDDPNGNGNDTNDSDVDPTTGETGPITVGIGETSSDNDAGVEDPGTASLLGRLFCDENDNSVDDGEPGVAGVTVTLSNGATAVTDADGNYAFTGLKAGTYSVTFPTSVGDKVLVEQNVGGDDTIDSDADQATGTTDPVTLAIGEQSLNNDAGVEIVDTGTSVIEGRIFCDENDNSVDDSEPGVGGVTVTLSNGATTVTNPDGSYAFTGLLAGTYTVTFPLTADGKVLVDSNVGGDDTIDSDADQGTGETGPITVGIGETSSDNDAGVEDPGTASVGDLVFLDANGNGVFDAGDGVVAGVTVDLLDADGNVVATTTTDAAGEYLFDGLDAGEYSALFTAPDGLEFTGQSGAAADAVNNDSDADVGTGETGSFILDIGEAERDVDAGLVVTDTGTASISGTYFCDENDDDVQNAGEPGISGALVTLLDAAGNPTGLTATTNANGNYAFTGLTAGTYSVLFAAEASGKTFVAQDDPNGNGNDTNDSDVDPTTGETGPITVGIGETSSDNDAGVEDPGTASLLGRLFCDENDNSVDDGEPGVAGVTVTLSNGATAVTDADGNYAFTGLKAGTYSVTFPTSVGDKVLVEQNVGGDDTIDSDADQATGTTDPVTLAIGEQSLNNDAGVEIVDTGTSVIEGRIFCDENDNSVDDSEPGVGGVTVTLSNGATTVTNPDGSYAFTGLLAGTYTVTFPLTADGKVLVDSNVGGDDTIDSDADQGTGETGPITVGIGETSSDNDAGVEDPGTASVGDLVFLDANGNGVFDAGDGVVAGVTVDLLDADGNVVATTTTDAAGEYLFDGLDAGEYSALFTAPDGLEFTGQSGAAADAVNNDSDADVGTGETGSFILDIGEAERDVDAGLVVTDTGTASISGTYFCDENDDDVQNAGEPGISGALVTLLDAAGNPTGLTATTNANGNYAFTGLTAGTYSVLFAAEASGKTFVAQDDPNGNGNDTNDSDVDPTTGETGPITVGIGETSSDNDAGVEDPGTASLLGRLFCDENDNSVDDGEPGVAGVTVTLSNGATAVTDADGNYAFTGLKAGTYSVTFPTSVGDKVLVEQNVGGDDTIDSDADQATGTTDPVTLAIGEQSLNNDAGVEIVDTGTSVIEGRIFCDENDNSVDDSEPGVGGVTVTLSNGATTVTNPDGSYAFTGLLAGTYTVTFPLTADGKVLVDSNVGGDDTIDSDADQGTGETGPITVGIGETSSDNDAGLFEPNTPPEAQDDMGKGCADEEIVVDVLANDSDAEDGKPVVTAVNGTAIVDGGTIVVDGVNVTLSGGSLSFDGEAAYAALDIGEEATVMYTYTVTDTAGATAVANIDVTYCGDANSVESFCDSLPEQIQYQISTSSVSLPFQDEAFDIKLTSPDGRFDGVIFEDAYCISVFDPAEAAETFDTASLLSADVFCFEDAPADVFNANQVSMANGKTAGENLDVVNWVINQDFKDQGFSDWEIQRTIWELTDNIDTDYLDAIDPAFGDAADVDALVALAVEFDTNKTGEYMPGLGDKIGVILDPNPTTSLNAQPFILAMEIEPFDCFC